MGDVMQGIEEDVPFDHGVCDALESACRSAATAIDGQRASRASYVTTAMQEFRGRFSELFTANADVAKGDASELASRLRDVAAKAAHLQECARAEQQRRETARQWKQEQDDRNGFERIGDWWSGGDEPPVGPPDPPAPQSVTSPAAGSRQTPAPGSGGGGAGGTTSAKPEDLRSFATGSQSLDSALSWRPASTQTRLDEFTAQCRWGELDASGVMSGFDAWLDANAEDISWAQTVADAFAAAGGEGAVSTLSDASLMAALQAAGVDATRDDIVIDPAIAVGNPPTTGYANDPVNTSTGNFIENEVDLGFTGGAATLGWRRSYSSFDDHVGAFGPGWSSACDVRLDLDDEGARLVLEDGRTLVFPRSGDGWGRATGENRWLAREDRDGRTLLVATDNAGGRTEFTTSGTWLSTSRGAGTRVEASYDEHGRLAGLAHERGRSVALRWDGAGDGASVVEAAASDGRRVEYNYDDVGRLTSARGPLGTRTYGWDDAGLVDRVVDADGVVEAENTYDEQRRVVTQRSQFGRVTRFAYLPGRVTVTSDEDGTRSNTWVSDGRGRVVGIVDAHGQRQSMAYDTHGNLVSATERDGGVTVNKYDDRGRKVRTVTPTGADLAFGHDDLDRVTTVATDGAVVTLEYVGDDRDPSVVVDPEGGRSELVWRDGLLVRVVDPVGVTVDLDHDEHGDLVATTNALGHVARLERDDAGRVVASVTPSGARTTFTYDGAGTLLSRRDPDGAEWRFEHTTAGRLTAVVDPLGVRTVTEVGPETGEPVAHVDGLGHVTRRELDDLGNTAVVVLPDGSRWSFVHDAMSRLVEMVDPLGATWRREHGANGEVVAEVDPDGVRRAVTTDRRAGTLRLEDDGETTGVRFDALGRPVASERADGSSALATYDRCGRVVELVDAEGGLTLLRRDAAGKVVERVSPSGATHRFERDAAGRLVATVDPSGARTQLGRDADGRVVRVVQPTGEVATIAFDVCGRVVRRTTPGRGVERFAYDACGRVATSADPWFGSRRFRYDAAGRLVEVVNGVGGVTRIERDVMGRAVAITDPLGHTTRREHDAVGRCTSEIDPLGRTRTAGYDALGRQVWQQDATGRRLGWVWDRDRLVATTVDGGVNSTRRVDLRRRTLTVVEQTDDGPVEHRLAFDRRGLLLSRSRGDRTTTWTYDVDGRRRTMTTPDGLTTSYEHDPAGRLSVIEHPVLGRAELERDAAGRIVRASAGGAVATWEHVDGHVVAHTAEVDGVDRRTEVVRDEDGRILRLVADGVRTEHAYDGACRLVRSERDGSVSTWEYDDAGRMVAETVAGARRELSHDAAGQLRVEQGPSGRVEHTYDALGRRTRTAHPDGTVRELVWHARGWLAAVSVSAGATTRRTEIRVDALGELASVDGTEVVLDSAASYARRPVLVGGTSVLSAGPMTGIGDAWETSGWRQSRGVTDDPWSVLDAVTPADGPVSLGPAGEVVVAGLEWLEARVYDPATRGFLSVDPLDPVPGSGWAGDPYAYAGHDPLHALDPSGLRPVTEEELQTYIESQQGKWEYVAAAAAIGLGAALMFTGVGGPIGMMLISGGVNLAMQRREGKDINWLDVGIATGLGALPGVGLANKIPLGAVARSPVATNVVRGVVNGGLTGARDGAATGAVKYTFSGNYTADNFGQTMWNETVDGARDGAIAGGIGNGSDMLGQRMITDSRADRLLSNADEVAVVGRQSDTEMFHRDWWEFRSNGHAPQMVDDWHPQLNEAFERRAIDQGRDVYEASNGAITQDGLQRMVDGGYETRTGDPNLYSAP